MPSYQGMQQPGMGMNQQNPGFMGGNNFMQNQQMGQNPGMMGGMGQQQQMYQGQMNQFGGMNMGGQQQ